MKEIKTLDFKIDPKSALPVYEQIKQEIKSLVLSGYLEEGDRMMPIRDLAELLKVNSNTIVKVYYQLDVEGYLESQHGSGYYVKFDAGKNLGARERLFETLTADYISKAMQLGYTAEEIGGEIKKRLKKNSKDDNKKKKK
jgi:DNA-binding transcriptional regulator YhcF (GntR family)